MNLTEIANIDVQSKLGVITDNLPMIKKQIEEALKPYMGKEVSIDNLQDAKKSRAELKKIFNVADTKRKSLKNEWNTPYKKWEVQFKDSISFLTECIDDLDGKIKETEQKELDKKMLDIESLIDERLAIETESTAQFIRDINWFRDSKWSNKGETLKKIENQINATVDNINRDLDILSRDEEFYSPMLDKYKEYGDLGQALSLKERLVVEKNRMAQMKAEAEARREQRKKELEEEAETQRRLEQERLAKQPVVEAKPSNDLFGITEDEPVVEDPIQEEPVQEEEPQSIPLSNDNWQETEYANREQEKEDTPMQPLVIEPKKPEILYTCAKDYVKISIGYEFVTDVATARYIKDMAIFKGAEAKIIVPPKAIKGAK